MPSVAEPTSGTIQDTLYRILEGALHRLKMQPGAARHIGLRQLHRIPGEPLGWYLWLSGAAGAWRLRLAGLRPSDPFGGLFVVHYYPEPDDAVIHGFSADECAWRRDPALFDETGTPRARAASLPEDAFAVGTLEVLSDGAVSGVLLRARAQDWWVETGNGRLAPGRRVAGWDLTWQVADCLIQILAFTARAVPVQVRVGHRTGVYGRRSQRGEVQAVADPLLTQWTLDVVLPLPGPTGPQPVTPETCATFAATTVENVDWLPTLTQPPFGRQPFINIAWWTAARWEFPADGAVCSHCEADGAHDHGHDHPAANDPDGGAS